MNFETTTEWVKSNSLGSLQYYIWDEYKSSDVISGLKIVPPIGKHTHNLKKVQDDIFPCLGNINRKIYKYGSGSVRYEGEETFTSHPQMICFTYIDAIPIVVYIRKLEWQSVLSKGCGGSCGEEWYIAHTLDDIIQYAVPLKEIQLFDSLKKLTETLNKVGE